MSGRPRRSNLALVAAALLLSTAACRRSVDVDAAVAAIQDRFGVTVQYRIGPDFLPAEWREQPTNGRVEPIGERELATILHSLPSWLEKYPAGVLRANLTGVRLASTLQFYGTDYAGTASDSFVYIVDRGRREGFDGAFLERTFHHEFSSVLIYHHPFPIYDWVDANPDGFQYLTEWDEVLDIMERRPNLNGDPKLYSQGLLAEYGRTNLENDVNLYAEVTFAEPQRMRQLVQQYPLIRAKYRILKSYYMGVDSAFASWFQRIE